MPVYVVTEEVTEITRRAYKVGGTDVRAAERRYLRYGVLFESEPIGSVERVTKITLIEEDPA